MFDCAVAVVYFGEEDFGLDYPRCERMVNQEIGQNGEVFGSGLVHFIDEAVTVDKIRVVHFKTSR